MKNKKHIKAIYKLIAENTRIVYVIYKLVGHVVLVKDLYISQN